MAITIPQICNFLDKFSLFRLLFHALEFLMRGKRDEKCIERMTNDAHAPLMLNNVFVIVNREDKRASEQVVVDWVKKVAIKPKRLWGGDGEAFEIT